MSLLALLAARHATPGPTPPVGADLPSVEETPIPYTMPTAAPWNAPVRAIVPTYDGSDEPTHPGVVDMVAETGKPWKGYRYWMVHTPYPRWQDLYENPSVVVSNNGFDWHDAAVGIVNPIIPEPTTGGYNSDGDLFWNPDRSRMEMVYRPMTSPGERVEHLYTTDGVNWSTPTVAVPANMGGWVSPSVVRLGPGRWRMFGVNSNKPNTITYRDAPDPSGPWSGQVPTTEDRAGLNTSSKDIWHMDVTSPDASGKMYGLMLTYPGGSLYAITSRDEGLTWTYNPVPVLNTLGGNWDRNGLYRATMTTLGDTAQVWYGHNGNQVSNPPAGIGYTRIPLSEWP